MFIFIILLTLVFSLFVVLGKVRLKRVFVGFSYFVAQVLPFLKMHLCIASSSSIHKASCFHRGAEVPKWSQNSIAKGAGARVNFLFRLSWKWDQCSPGPLLGADAPSAWNFGGQLMFPSVSSLVPP